MRARAPLGWRRTFIRLLAVCLPVLLLGGCILPPEPATTEAEQINTLFLIVLFLGAAVFVGVEGFLLYAVFRYRRRDDQLPVQYHGHTLVEIVWTAIPTVIVLILFVTSMLTLGSISARSSDPVTIEVEGFQWQWIFRYSNGHEVTGSIGDSPAMVVPAGEPVRLVLRSADVIHSFFVPAFLVKMDLIPFGQAQAPNELEFTVTEPGVYRGQCAEFCGLLHADMTFTVDARPAAEFATWLQTASEETPPPPSPSIPPDAVVVELSAEDIAYNTLDLEVPAGEPFIIRFTNLEDLVHNVSVYEGETTIMEGAEVTGPDTTIDYVVPALDPGEYTYICDFHPIPAMTGTLTAR